MQKYRNKKTGAIVEACKVSEDTVDNISNWANGAQIVEEKDALTGSATEGLNIKTPEGKRRASRGMYVIKHAELFYVGGPVTFEAVYEPVQE